MSRFKERLLRLYEGEGRWNALSVVRRAFTLLLPVFFIGASALAVRNFPIAGVQDFIESACGGVFAALLDAVYAATCGFAAAHLAFVVSCCETRERGLSADVRIFAVLTAVGCYVASLGGEVLGSAEVLSYLKMSHIFPAFIVSLGATHLFLKLTRLQERGRTEYVSTVTRGLRAVLPAVACLTLFALTAPLIRAVSGERNFNDLIYRLLARLFSGIGATYFGGLLILLVESLLWFFGIHGANVLDPLLTDPAGAFAGGEIVSKGFFDTYALMGGCGTALCFCLALLIFSGDRKKRKVCRLGGVPLLFNINEIVVFGVPVVLNPVYLLPFVLTPAVTYTLAYLATLAGIVPPVTASVQWTTPILISGYRATGSIAGALLQLFLLVVGVGTYTPFVLLDNRWAKAGEARFTAALTDICKKCEAQNQPYAVPAESTMLHTFEDTLAERLYKEIKNGTLPVNYQPQVEGGEIVSAEALLRFRGGGERCLYPPLVVNVARSHGLYGEMSRAITMRALSDLCEMQKVRPDFRIAVNYTYDLLVRDDFRAWLIDAVAHAGIARGTFGAELTEDSVLSDDEKCDLVFEELRAGGIEILMDDFSMGHTSLSVLRKNYFDYVKVDGSLIRDLENERCRSIVASVVRLGETLNFRVIAEYVETEAQRDELARMGCNIYQGYLYYRDMPADALHALLVSSPAREKESVR